ncbi:DNA mismatch repair protein MutS [Salinirubrum litoreum]|uniref:DNA mismatch repair protein MutS n=1 Tax=Salinirubrum litoreum TaxID=1126234 RepID=A0ABD5RDH5_9EURY|nr:DNA mismatch repair protein MutS [Salinirubrum litoreum]
MPAVTGPPPEMAESRGDLTPMMRQYFELTAEYDDCLVLFQVGDFYEAFCDAAEEVSKVLEVTLTQREDSTGTYRMAGIPIDNAASYVEGLLDAGYRVAVADQVEDPDEASGVVDRAVTRVVTPGTVTDDELLAGSATYLACLARETDTERVNGASAHTAGARTNGASAHTTDATHAVAFLDVSTGEFRVTSVESRRRAIEELDRVDPAEVVFAPEFADTGGDDGENTAGTDESDADDPGATDPRLAETFDLRAATTVYDPDAFDTDSARDRVGRYVDEPDAVLATDAELRACGGLLAYAEYTQGDGVRGDVPEEPAAVGDTGGSGDAEESADTTDDPTDADPTLGYVTRIRRYDPDDALRLDPTAIRSLELFENRTREDGPTLLGVVDDTSSALGRRRLESWLRRPLLDTGRIDARQAAVAAFAEESLVRAEVRDLLEAVYDVERLLGRVARSRANARDLRSLKTTLDTVPELKSALASVDQADSDRLVALRDRLDELADVRGLIDDAISEDPPAEITEGGIVASGYDDELDALRETEQSGREWVADLEARERERTGIDSLSVGYNQVHGYYIEVTKPNLDRVPDDYTRRQTLKNSERFYTPELKRREDEIIGAAERADALEYDLFREVRRAVAEEAERVQDVADALAELDTLATLAEIAVDRDWTRPEVVDYDAERADSADESAPAIDIEHGRHPVVADAQSSFVPNDTHLGDSRVAVVTGPNMSGKSTYMRQVALICLLAQVGSFVPADAARLPTLDRIFTRVGASDDIAGGQSTFMREMSELTDILHDATERSLVLLDEVGRGTSTTDGLSIAWATTEFVHDEIGAFTLFATHYHELTAIADELPGVTNRHFAADRDDSGVTFRHEVREGPASSSYGVEVAGLAGVPDPVVARSRDLVAVGGPGGPSDATDAEGTTTTDPEETPTTDAEASDTGETVQATLEGDPATEPSDPETGEGDGAATADETVADLLAELREIDVADTTPLDALNRLHDLRELAASADVSAADATETASETTADHTATDTDR